MNCRTARHLLDLHLDGELPADQTRLLLAHLAQCSRCEEERQRLERQEALLRRTLPRPGPSEAEVERAVLRVAARLRDADATRLQLRPAWWRWRWVLSAAVACVVVGLLWWLRLPRPSDGIPVAEAGSAVFSRDHRWVAFAMPDGLYVRELPHGAALRVALGRCSEPTWSPDGAEVAFLEHGTDTRTLAVVDRRGRGLRVLLRGEPRERLVLPQWAPRGTWILLTRAAVRSGTPSATLWLVDAVRREAKIKVDDLGRTATAVAAWAPDSRHFAYVRWTRNADGNLILARPDRWRRGVGRIVGVAAPQIAWAPDSRRLLYITADGRERGFTLTMVGLDGSSTVVDQAAQMADPAWAPSGRLICYANPRTAPGGRPGRTAAALVVITTGGDPEAVIKGVEADDVPRRPVWSPDGSQIAYDSVSVETGRSQVYVYSVSSDRRQPRRVSRHNESEALLGWDATGKGLLVEQTTDSGGRNEPEHSTWLRHVS